MIDEAIYTLLSNDAGITAKVSSRIYPLHTPQEPIFPALTFGKIAVGTKDLHHSGSNQSAKSLYQFSCFAQTLKQAKELAKAVKDLLHGYSGTVGSEKIYYSKVLNEIDLFDVDLIIYYVPVDVEILHKEL